MKPILYQTNYHFINPIQKYGCLFLCFYYKSPKTMSYQELNELWLDLVDRGIIVDDTIMDHNAVLKAFGINAVYNDRHDSVDTPIQKNQFAFAQLLYKGPHFVVVKPNKEIEYDPTPNSNSVKYGTMQSLRIYTYKE